MTTFRITLIEPSTTSIYRYKCPSANEKKKKKSEPVRTEKMKSERK